ncbi:MAG: hypothetical protein A2293_03350 [Elusimicrobia bacterium RIFOXYB2_FULL_49_7]|nr:MAG: hypothetical protein A2293_03350 [Elusimicrobia bacterium RIFOXYB2_FULL_49_7]
MGIAERKQREKEQRIELITKAAEELFLEKGLTHTTMDEIAEQCELSKAALYLYFNNKEDLFAAIMIKAMETLYNMMATAANKSDFSASDRLRAIGKAYLSFYKNNPGYFQIMNHHHDPAQEEEIHKKMAQGLDENIKRIFAIYENIWALSIDTVRHGMENGEFKQDTNAEEVTLGLWAGSNGVIQIMDHFRTHHKFLKENPSFPVPHVSIENVYIKIWEYTIDSLVMIPEDAVAKRALWNNLQPS